MSKKSENRDKKTNVVIDENGTVVPPETVELTGNADGGHEEADNTSTVSGITQTTVAKQQTGGQISGQRKYQFPKYQ